MMLTLEVDKGSLAKSAGQKDYFVYQPLPPLSGMVRIQRPLLSLEDLPVSYQTLLQHVYVDKI